MTDQEVLTKCIEIAWEGNWRYTRRTGIGNNLEEYILMPPSYKVVFESNQIESILFNHQFCKALFGDGSKVVIEGTQGNKLNFYPNTATWKYHIQQLAIAEDRIEYLRSWLKEQE